MPEAVQRFIEWLRGLVEQIVTMVRIVLYGDDGGPPKRKRKRESSKMERFTRRAQLTLSLSQETAERMGHKAILPEHILVAMARADGSIAQAVLKQQNIEAQPLEEQVKQMYPPGTPPLQHVDLADDTKKVLELAVDTARGMGHYYIGSEHLLIGMMRLDRAEINTILKHFKVDAATLINSTKDVLSQKLPPDVSEENP